MFSPLPSRFGKKKKKHKKAVLMLVKVLDKAGNHDLLRFPPFHQEMLTQSYWNAGENMGRVKVVISEGLIRGPGISPFERTRNLVSFSFQHAPLSMCNRFLDG